MTEDLKPIELKYRRVNLTARGLGLLALGTALLWLPYVRYPGFALSVAGLYFLLVGRKLYPQRHGKYVLASMIIYVLSLTLWAAITFIYTADLLSVFSSGLATAVKIESFRTWFLLYIIVVMSLWIALGFSLMLSIWYFSSRLQSILALSGWLTIIIMLLIRFIGISGNFWIYTNDLIDSGNYLGAIGTGLSYFGTLSWYVVIPAALMAAAIAGARSKVVYRDFNSRKVLGLESDQK